MQKLSKRLPTGSSESSLAFNPRGVLDEDDREDVVLCQVKNFTSFWAGSK
jgi:hypothetical protein